MITLSRSLNSVKLELANEVHFLSPDCFIIAKNGKIFIQSKVATSQPNSSYQFDPTEINGRPSDDALVVAEWLRDTYFFGISANTSATGGAIVDGSSPSIRGTVFDYSNSNPLAVRLTDTTGDYVSAGGGVQYTEGDTDASVTGTAIMMEDSGNTMRPVPGSATDGLLVNLGTNNDVRITDGAGVVNTKQLGTALTNTDIGLVTNTMIHGLSSAGGGTFVDVKVNPSGSLQVDTNLSQPLTDTQLRATPVNQRIFNYNYPISTANSSTAQLAAGASFNGTIEAPQDQPSISILLTSDQPITLRVRQFIDIAGSFPVPDLVFYVSANTGFARSFTVNGNFVQVIATNTGASTTTTFNLNTAFGTLGDADPTGTTPVTELPLILTGAAAQTATVNNILEPTSGTTPTSVSNYRSASIQVASTGTGGTFIFEQSNNNVNWVALPVFNSALVTAVPITAAITATSSQIIYTFPIRCNFLRLRIATTITGGSIQAFSRISTEPWTPTVQLVASNTAANLNATIASPVIAAGTNRIATIGTAGIWFDDSSATLTANSTFTGTSRDHTVTATGTAWANAATYGQELVVSAESDVTGTLWIETSRDNTNWRRVKSIATSAVTGGGFYAEIIHRPSWRYSRVGYTNGAGAQARFTIGSFLKAI